MEIFTIAVVAILLLTIWGVRNARKDRRKGRSRSGWSFDGGGDSDGGGGGGD